MKDLKKCWNSLLHFRNYQNDYKYDKKSFIINLKVQIQLGLTSIAVEVYSAHNQGSGVHGIVAVK